VADDTEMIKRDTPDSFSQLRSALPAAYRTVHHASGSPTTWTFDVANIEQPPSAFSDPTGVAAFALRRLQALYHVTEHGSLGMMIQSLISDTLLVVHERFPNDGTTPQLTDLYNSLAAVATEIADDCSAHGWNVHFAGLGAAADGDLLAELDADADD
jgi:hypothetical protein